ncbi:hypothetical protein JHK85_045473 [Glycine max]|nr:hypothetical protein JHK86_044858 [Glycine max]KAG4951606.1 hypothetical protein JHK85_045473 [Glycine max]
MLAFTSPRMSMATLSFNIFYNFLLFITFVQAEASAKAMDDTIVCGVTMDLTHTSIMDKTPKTSNATINKEVVHRVQETASKQPTTLSEATSREKGELDVIIVYSTSSGPAHLNYAPLIVVIRDQVQDMIGQAMESFTKHQRQENEQFRLSMQNAIMTQFSNLGVVLLQNLQQAHMSMLGVVVAPTPAPIPAPQTLEPSP